MSVIKIEDAFTDAASRGDVKALTALLEQGANVNETDKEGYSALQVASKKGRLEVVEYLLQCGADVNQRDSDGFSALHEAAFGGYDDIVRVLLRAGANKTFVTSRIELFIDMTTADDDAHGGAGAGEGKGSTPQRWYLHIAYYGTGLVGWQRQLETSSTGLGSVQELVEDAVTKAFHASERINVTSASRTDAGTHALYQFATIKVPATGPSFTFDDLQRQLNDSLPESVRILKVASVPASVRPSRFRSKYKKYIYYIQQGHRPDLELGKFSWFLGRRLDVDRLREALQHLVGTHDFLPFSQGLQKAELADRSTVRTIISINVRVRRNVVFSLDPTTCGTGELVADPASLYEPVSAQSTSDASDCTSHDDKKRRVEAKPRAPVHFVCVELIADGFLRHMVRRIIGTVRPIAEGTYPASRMLAVLNGELEPGPSAPTKGLWLHRTWLTQEDWDSDETKHD
ncbi:hypothetical protein PINS_up000496 [Pythium insidiosum]|nr:hypothetical protein PINS_up000496 [Pythium insidiosum]